VVALASEDPVSAPLLALVAVPLAAVLLAAVLLASLPLVSLLPVAVLSAALMPPPMRQLPRAASMSLPSRWQQSSTSQL